MCCEDMAPWVSAQFYPQSLKTCLNPSCPQGALASQGQASAAHPRHSACTIHPSGKETRRFGLPHLGLLEMSQSRETAKTILRGQICSVQLWRSTLGFHSDQLFNGALMTSISRALSAKAYLSPPPLPDGRITVQNSSDLYFQIYTREAASYVQQLVTLPKSDVINACT